MPRLVDPRAGNTRTANRILLDRMVRHAHFLERLKTHEARQIVRFLNEQVLPDLTAQIERRLNNVAARGAGSFTNQRLQYLRQAIRDIVRAGYAEAYSSAKTAVNNVALAEARWQVAALEEAIGGLSLQIAAPSPPLLRSIVTSRPFEGRLMREWFGSLAIETRTGIERAINIGVAQGETTEQIVRRVRGTRTTPGVYRTSRRRVESTVRTAINHVATQAREITYNENGDLIKGVRWVSTLDARTSLICMDLDGQVYPIDDGPRPPAHYNCRSTTIPILKSWRELGIDLDEAPAGTRASMDGQVPANLTYKDWLRDQPVSVQNEALGTRRAQLFRAGNIPGDRFTDRRNSPISLQRLLELEGIE